MSRSFVSRSNESSPINTRFAAQQQQQQQQQPRRNTPTRFAPQPQQQQQQQQQQITTIAAHTSLPLSSFVSFGHIKSCIETTNTTTTTTTTTITAPTTTTTTITAPSTTTTTTITATPTTSTTTTTTTTSSTTTTTTTPTAITSTTTMTSPETVTFLNLIEREQVSLLNEMWPFLPPLSTQPSTDVFCASSPGGGRRDSRFSGSPVQKGLKNSGTGQVKCTALYYAARLGKVELVMALLKKGVTIQIDPTNNQCENDSLWNGSIMSGNMDLIALLILCGCYVDVAKPTQPDIKKLQARYQKLGVYAVAASYPRVVDFLLREDIPQARYLKQDERKVTEAIDSFIAKSEEHQSRVRAECPGDNAETSLVSSLNKILGKERSLSDLFDNEIDANGKPQTVLFSVKQKLNMNIAIFLPGKNVNETICLTEYSNRVKKTCCPTVNLTFNGVRYHPLLDMDFDKLPQSMKSNVTTPSGIIAALKNESITPEEFENLLSNFDSSTINNLVPINDQLRCTLFYSACRTGKTLLVLSMVKFFKDSLSLGLGQHSISDSSPLHCAVWYGFTDIVTILLHLGASIDVQNREGEKPFNPAVSSGNRLPEDTLKKLSELEQIALLPPNEREAAINEEMRKLEERLFITQPPPDVLKTNCCNTNINNNNNNNCGSLTDSKIYVSVWYVMADDGWFQYDPAISRLLENAKMKDEKTVKVTVNSTEYLIDIEAMTQENLSSGRKREIKRWTNVSIDKLCEVIDSKNVNDFKLAISNFPKKNINNYSPQFCCTPLYLACKKGQFDIFYELAQIEGIELDGGQETKSGNENTPLHVANWYGNFRIVAYLLSYVKPSANKQGLIPGVANETKPFDNELDGDISIINKLDFCFALDARLPPPCTVSNERVEKFRVIWKGKELTVKKSVRPITLSERLSLPNDPVPPQYLYLTYLWYEKVGHSKKLNLLPLSHCSCLDTEYQKYLNSPTLPQEVNLFAPPQKGSRIWESEIWKVDFEKFTATLPNGQIKELCIFKRPRCWFYRSEENNLVPFSYEINHEIEEGYLKHNHTCSYKAITGYFWRRTTTVYEIYLKVKEVIITVNNQSSKTYPLLNEEDLERLTQWNPYSSIFEGRLQCKYKKKELKKENPERSKVEESFYTSIPRYNKEGKEINRIVSINKLMNSSTMMVFQEQCNRLWMNHQNNPNMEQLKMTRLLWHGTGILHPEKIYESEGAFLTNYSSDSNLWGKACYFASEAAYSADYAYETENNTKIMLMVKVLVGQPIQCLESPSIVINPPPLTTGSYDSVLGYRNGSWIYVVYQSGWGIPIYEVEWLSK